MNQKHRNIPICERPIWMESSSLYGVPTILTNLYETLILEYHVKVFELDGNIFSICKWNGNQMAIFFLKIDS